MPTALRALALALAVLCLQGCSSLAYYAQLARGGYDVLARRQPIQPMLTDPAVDPGLRARLSQALQAREFASSRLALPRNGSYTRYADVGRPYVLWNVFATPALSLSPVTHCFPIAGCVAYRGYYSEQAARDEAARLAAQGDDTEVSGVPAYSTLGWFDDPILNTMAHWDDDHLDGMIFHELAHQRLYVKGDTAFNESYASFVQQQGLREWRAQRGMAAPKDAQGSERKAQFTQLVLDARGRLEALYASGKDEASLRAGKQAEFERLHADYLQLRDGLWQGYAGYDAFFARPLNNARLLPFGLYDQWVPAFAALFRQSQSQWPKFHEAAAALAKLDRPAREAQLKSLAATSSPTMP